MSHSTHYDDDIVLWSEQQAEVIRRLGRTRRDLPNELDIENVAEEIESVGRSEMASVESFLRLTMLHLIKIAAVPGSQANLHWRDEARNFSIEAQARFAPSMAQRLELQRAWRGACHQVTASFAERGDPLPALPRECPFSVEELIRQPPDLDSLISRIGAESAPAD